MSNATIVLLEDEPDLATLLRELLEAVVHRVEPAGRLAEVLARPPPDGPTLVLADLTLPDAGPDEVVRGLRSHLPGRPLVLMSAMERRTLRRIGAERGADAVLAKPFGLDELRAVLAPLLQPPSGSRLSS